MSRWYVLAYRAGNGNVIPMYPKTVRLEDAKSEAETACSNDPETEYFVAFRDEPEWQQIDA